MSHFRRLILPLLILFGMPAAHSQVAGLSTLTTLDMATSARAAGLGMDYLSVWDSDLNVAIDNPSLISKRHGNLISFDYVGLFSGAHMGSLNYGYNKSRVGAFLFGLRFNNFGRFDGYDENENPTGSFSAADYTLNIGWGIAIDSNFSFGAAFKPTFSHYESYSSFALAFDLAGSYVSDSRRFSSTIMARNIGAQVLTFDGTREPLPFELSASLSYKVENAPFRFYLAATELQRWNLIYNDSLYPTTSTDLFTGQVTSRGPVANFADNLFRHVNVGMELCLSRAFFARVGYRYRQAAETRSTSLTSINSSGFSFGFGFRVKGFELAYARNNYYLSKAPNYISITTSLDRFFK